MSDKEKASNDALSGVASRRHCLVLVAGLPCVACGSASQPAGDIPTDSEIAQESSVRIASQGAWAEADTYWPFCQGAPKRVRGCGLLTERVTVEWVRRVMEEVCGEDPNISRSLDCDEKVRAKVVEAFQRRYTRVATSDVVAVCQHEPRRCQGTYENLELVYMTAHNTAVIAIAQRGVAALRAEEREARAEARQQREARAREREREAEEQERTFAAFTGALAGAAAALNTQHGTPTPGALSAAEQCSSDYTCGLGRKCSKPARSYVGVCATSVNAYGTPQYAPSRDGNIGPGKRQCLPGGCAVGFTCVEGRCVAARLGSTRRSRRRTTTARSRSPAPSWCSTSSAIAVARRRRSESSCGVSARSSVVDRRSAAR